MNTLMMILGWASFTTTLLLGMLILAAMIREQRRSKLPSDELTARMHIMAEQGRELLKYPDHYAGYFDPASRNRPTAWQIRERSK